VKKAANMTEPLSDSWILAAEGELGDRVYWQPEFHDIEKTRGLLCLLEEIGGEAVDWSYLLKDLPYFAILKNMSFPPLYLENAFDNLEGFFTIVEEPGYEIPRMTFNQISVYVDKGRRDYIISQFRELGLRLRAYPALQRFIHG
jgi:hypothetical protein